MFGTQFGTVPYFLPELARNLEDYGSPWLKRATRTMIALFLPHGVPIWGFYCDIDELNRYVAVQDQFGIEAAEFVPYYERPDEVALEPPPGPEAVLVSYWQRPGRLLIVLGNIAEQAYQGRLVLRAEALGKAPGAVRIVDPCTGRCLTENGLSAAVAVPAKDYQLLEVTCGHTDSVN
jgi:hypothetical protein